MAKTGRFPAVGGGGGITPEQVMENITYATSQEAEDKTLTNVVVNPAGLANFEKTYSTAVADTQSSPIFIAKTTHKINYVSDIQVFESTGMSGSMEVETENYVTPDGDVVVSFIVPFNGTIIINGR